METKCRFLSRETKDGNDIGRCAINNHDHLSSYMNIKSTYESIYEGTNIMPNNECPFFYQNNIESCPEKK